MDTSEFSGLQAFVKTLELELDLAIDEARTSIISDLPEYPIGDTDDSCVDTTEFWSSEAVLSPNGKLVTSITKDLSQGDRSAMKCVLQEVCADETSTHLSPQKELFDINTLVGEDTFYAEYRVANLDDEFKKVFDRQEKVSADELNRNFLRDSDEEGSDDGLAASASAVNETAPTKQLFDGPDEMEYVLPVVVTNEAEQSTIKPVVAPTASPLKSRVIDKRVFGDAAGWDKGSRLTLEGIKIAYGGLYDTLFHTGNYKSIYVQEFVVRPDTQLVMLMNAIAIAAKSIQLVFSRRQRSQGIISHPTRTGAPSPNKSRSMGRSRWTEEEEEEEEEKEWDAVDVQVCVSRELRHRVVLCQFLQKSRASGMSLRNNERNAANSRIERVNKAIQKQLTNSGLCLSNLYLVPPEQVCEEFQVDSHFFVQMENLHREQMWQTLEREFASMDRHFQTITDEYLAFVKAMQPIYTQHGIPFPTKAVREDPEDTSYRNRSVVLNEASELVPHSGADGPEQLLMGDMMQSTISPKPLGRNNISSHSLSSKNFPPVQAIEPNETYTDGMTKCLSCLALLGKHLMKGCDRELTFRLQKQNSALVAKMSRLHEHTKLLLFRLAESDAAEVSSLNRTLLTSFDGVTLSSPTSFSRFLSTSALTRKQSAAASTSAKSSPVATATPVPESNPRRSLFGGFLTTPPKAPVAASAPALAAVSGVTGSATRSLSREEDMLYRFSSQPLSSKDSNIGWGGGIYKLVVMYTCSVLVSALSLPGSIYITPEFIFVISGIQIPGLSISMSAQRECYSLRHLKSVSPVTNSALPFITSNTLELAFYEDTKILYITPVAVNKALLQSVISRVKENFVGV